MPDTSPGKRPPTRTHGRSISGSYAAINRHEMPLTTPDCVNIDRRRETAMGVGDLIAYIGAGPDRDQDNKAYVEAVHRLTDLGAVVTYAAHETSQEGFDAEWRGIAVLTVDGDWSIAQRYSTRRTLTRRSRASIS